MKIAVIGLGSIGRRHLLNFTALGCEMAAYDPAFSEPGHTLADALDGADGCVIATPPASHVDIAWKALAAGCHLLIEKPVALSLDGLERLFTACEKAGATAMVGYQWRYDRSMNEKRASLADIGPVRSWSCWYSYNQAGTLEGMATARRMGPLLDCSHAIDFLRWLMDEPASIRCRVADSGETAKLDMRFGLASGWALLSLATPMRCEWQIIGENRVVNWKRARDVTYDLNETYLAEAAHFLACIRGEAQPLTSGRDAMKTLAVALDARG